MWSHLTLLLIVGAAVVGSEPDHAWTKDKEYRYSVRTQTITSIDKVDKQGSGVLTKTVLVVQVKSPDVLRAKLIEPQYAQVHTQQGWSQDWYTQIPEHQVEFRELPMSGKPFEIHLKHGTVRDMLVDQSVSTWEVNMLKSIVSQLQVDVQGENAILTKYTQIPSDEQPYATFTAMEDSVGGNCEVLYDIMPFRISEFALHDKPDLVPLPQFRGDGNYFDIIKTKDYTKCAQQSEYHFGIDGKTHFGKWRTDPTASLLAKSSTSRVIISGTLKQFTIQSSVTTNDIVISPRMNNDYFGTVYSKVNLTLASKEDISEPEIPSSSNFVSTGNLVYIYNNPFGDNFGQKLRSRRPSISRNSMPVQSSESSDSSTEGRHRSLMSLLSNDRLRCSDSKQDEQEENFLQCRPKLDEPPENPLLPYFIGFNGQNIQKSDKIDLVRDAGRLCKEIAKELEKFVDVVSNRTLEKFTILIRLIRLMNVQQINDVQKNKFNSAETPKYCWVVYRNAVAQAGTGPALLTIKRWIKEAKLQNLEASQVISMIPKVARTPTPEYVREYFELIKEPIVQKQAFVNGTAPFAFAELILNAQVSETRRKSRYPIHAFGPMIPEDDEMLVKTYIPYMAQQLREAIQNNDSPRAQAYIMGLGKLGHPQILSVFELYLEGTQPVSKHQRVLIIASLTVLAENFPKLARSVLYKIYTNPEEAHEVRIAAIYSLMKTNPPLVMLQRMAQYTNYDKDEQVNSVVKSLIESLAELNLPEWQELSDKARIARKLLTPKEFSYKHSRGYFKNVALHALSKIQTVTLQTISDESGLPKALYFGNPSEDFLGHPKMETAYLVSNIRQFFKTMEQREDEGKSHEIDQIIRALNMQPQVLEQLEGLWLYNDMYGSFLYPFDNHTIERIFKMFFELTKQRSPMQQMNLNSLYSYDMTVNFPTETGFPFTYVMQRPTYWKVQARTNQEHRSYSSAKSSGAFEWAYASKTMARFGFVTPFKHQFYAAGVDTDSQIMVPVAYEYERNVPEKTVQFRVRPSWKQTESQSEFKVAHYGVVPFTARINLLELQPVSFNRNMHIARTSDQQTTEYNFDMFRVKFQRDGKSSKYSKGFSAFIKQLFSFPREDDTRYKMLDVYLNNDQTRDWTSINLAYDRKEFDIKSKDSWPSTKELSTIFKPQMSSQKRRDVMLKEVSRGVVSPTAQAVDLIIDVPNVPQQEYIVTFGLAESSADDRPNYQTLFHFQSMKDKKPNYEVCSRGFMDMSQRIPLDYEKALERVPEEQFHWQMEFGTTCANGNSFNITGTETRTEELKEAIINSEIAKECEREMQQGNKALRACQKANALTELRNRLSISLEIPDELINEGFNTIIDSLSRLPVKHNLLQNNELLEKLLLQEETSGTQKINLELTMSSDFKKAELALRTSEMDLKLPPVDLSEIIILTKEADRIWKLENDDVTCTIDKNKAITFDNKVYPVELGKCQHVMMITRPYWNNPAVPKVAVIVQEKDDGSKKLQLILGSDSQIDLQKAYNDLEIKINNQKIMLPSQGSYLYRVADEIVAEIYKLPDNSVRVDSRKYFMNVVYDGDRVQLQVSDVYRNAIRGLCGNYDWQPSNDFMTSKECVLDKPEEFTATYALTERNCQGPVLKNKRRAEQAKCIKMIYRQSNVISDKEAGRPWTENKQWGYHWNRDQEKTPHCTIYRTRVVEDNDNFCFTVRPLPECAANCEPVEMKTKRVPVHCLPKNEASIDMKRRIEKGANPDMSHRSVSKMHVFKVPIACTAAELGTAFIRSHNIMWLRFALLLIIGAALADHDHAWEKGTEYRYLVHSRTLTDLGELTKEYSGILIKGDLIVQAISSDTLQAVISKPRYARVHRPLLDGWDSWIPVETVEPRELPMSGKPFKIKLKHGLIRDLMVEKDTPTWEINLLKSIISQLQVDTQGENKIRSRSTQVPDDEQPYAMFRAMEDSVAGKCEVLYDIMPLPETTLHERPELVPLTTRGDDHYLITKTKNYTRCEQKMRYQFGIGGKMKWSHMSNPSNAGYVSRTSMSRIVISGNLKRFTIQSSVTVDKMVASHKTWTGTVHSRVNVTLEKVDKMSNPLPVSDDVISTGNLVYTYNDPFSDVKKHKASPSIGRNSLPVMSSESHSSESSSEERYGGKDPLDSSSGSDASISIANSNERSYLRSKPSLDQVPGNALLPYFIGYKGKVIDDSKKVDAVEAAAQLIKMIPEQIEYTRVDSRSLGLLEKFTILSKLIRTMNTKQIAQLEEKVAAIVKEIPDNLEEDLKKYFRQNYGDVLRDALTQAGTGPAFMTLRRWIKEKKLEGAEAARIVSRLPKTVRVPTAEYIQAFFEMITQPEVMQQRFLNTTAPLAFAELVFYAQISETEQYNRYPVFTFGRMVPKEDRAVVETYIPYMAKQLKEAIKDGDSPRIQTYIFALGNFGHPKILSVFEPYLEGTVPVSNFQRMMMVLSLNKLAETNPRMVRSVAYKIYLNVREADEVRTMAVFMVMKTNPPLTILQRMAAFTNYDDSKQVNSAVRNIIETLANSKMEEPQWQDLVNKARIAKDLLKPQKYDEKYSQAFFKKFAMENVIYKLAMFVVGSDDSYLPKAEFLNLGISYGAFNLPTSEVGYVVSSMKQFLAIWDTLENDDNNEQPKPSIIEEIVRALDIQPEDPQQLEGNIFWNSFYDGRFYPFDNHTIERIVETWSKKFMKAMEPGLFQPKNINHLESFDITVGFPMESGMPFIYTFEAPRMMRLSGEGKFNIKPQEGFTTNLNIAGHLVMAENILNRVGFMAPFEHHEYIAGVDEGWQLFLPIGFEVKFEPAQKNIQLKLHPDNYYKYGLDMITFGASIIPYTSSYDILQLQPVILDKGTKIAYSKKPQNIELKLIDNIHVMMSSDLIEEEENIDFESRYELLTRLVGDNANYKVLNIVLKSLPGEINVSFDVVETDANSKGDHETWPTLPAMVDKQPDSEARRQQFLKEVSKDINSATNYIVDVDVSLPAVMRNREIFTIGISESNVDDKTRGLLFWKQMPKSEENPESDAMELCAAGLMRSTRDILLDPEKALKRIPTDELNMEMQIGKTCEDGLQIRIEGNMTRSDDLKEVIMDSEQVEKCRHEMKRGNKGMRACQEVIALANMKDHGILSMDIKSELIRDMMNQLIQFASQKLLSDESVEVVSSKNERKTIDLEVKLAPDFETAEATLRTAGVDIKFDPLDLSETALSSVENKIDEWLEEEEEPETSCTLDKTEVLTFDNRSYPVKLGKCWHVMMTTYSKRNPENPNEFFPIPEEMQLAVVVQDTDDNHRQVRMIMGDNKLEMHKSGDHVEATLNGEKVPFSQYKSYRVKEDDETIIEIFELPDGSVRVMSEKYEMNVVYDGERVRLELFDEYRNDIRGLCGNYDGQPDNDFITPKNCILKDPEEFTATYAMTKDSCEGPAMENKQKAEKSKCIRMRNLQSNVISDREAGRPWIENKKWGYHHEHLDASGKRCTFYRTKIVEEGDEICFTTRPLPICAEGCKPTEMKTKKYLLHCMPKNESSMHLKKRIEKGANPDMTQRSVSKSHSFEVPLSCSAA
ncbi:uncharacterized protein LOC105281428 [Ooceraea biroi]|nr:uncharacterized protein LOC105281428 [Ooceraea biroi]